MHDRHGLTSTEPGSWCSCRHRSLNVPHIPAVNARRIHAQQQAANSGSAPHCQRPKGPGIEEVVGAKRGLRKRSRGRRQGCMGGSEWREVVASAQPQHSCATRRGMACAAAPSFSTVVRPKHRCCMSGSTPHLDGIADVGRETARQAETRDNALLLAHAPARNEHGLVAHCTCRAATSMHVPPNFAGGTSLPHPPMMPKAHE